MKRIYKLTRINLTGLGGPMGTERTWHDWEKYYTDISKAKSVAAKDHEETDNREKIRWTKDRDGKRFQTNDLLSHQYEIKEIEIEQ